MENKKAYKQEVHWLFGSKLNAGPQANNKVAALLGNDVAAHFAKLKAGSGYYEWIVNDDYTFLTDADPVLAQEVNGALATLHNEVRAKAPSIADKLLKVPNSDYVLFRRLADGSIDILLTGWGFENNKRAIGGSSLHTTLSDRDLRNDVPPAATETTDSQIDDITEESNDNVEETLPPQPPVIPEPPQPPVIEEDEELPPRQPNHIAIHDYQDKPIADVDVTFHQGSAEYAAHLDSFGACSIPADVFAYGTPVTAEMTIRGNEKVSIPFTLEQEETQYLISEEREQTSPWKRVLEIIAIILMIGALIYLGFIYAHGANDLAQGIIN